MGVIQWGPARNAVKYGVYGYAYARGRWRERTGSVPEIANILAAGPPKAGSQWMRALFHHPAVRSRTGLFTLPQLDYARWLHRGFPAGTFVPGVSCTYEEYLRMPAQRPHRVVFMFRDPRNLAVSGYYSAVKTHRKMGWREVEDYRDRLRRMPLDDALLDLIVTGAYRLRELASWVDVEHPSVAKFRLEDVETDPRGQVVRMLRHCGVELSEAELDALLADISRDALQAQDLARRKDGESHYRVDRKTFRDLFKPQHYEALESIVPGLCARLGYPD